LVPEKKKKNILSIEHIKNIYGVCSSFNVGGPISFHSFSSHTSFSIYTEPFSQAVKVLYRVRISGLGNSNIRGSPTGESVACLGLESLSCEFLKIYYLWGYGHPFGADGNINRPSLCVCTALGITPCLLEHHDI
jgi:hypothetical protein